MNHQNKAFRLILTMVLMVSIPLYSMEEHKIVVEAEKNVTRLNIVLVEEPVFSLGCCIVCKKEPTLSCECQGVDYCSNACQKQYAEKHQKDCLKIKKADHGDMAQIENFLKANIASIIITKNKKRLPQVLAWHYRHLVRIRQDLACCTDKSTKNALYVTQASHCQWLKHLVDEKFIEGTDLGTDADRTNYMLDAVTWVEERMKNDTLVSPEGILAYGMHYFLKSINPVQEEKLIAEQEWKEKRFAVLYEYRNKLTKKS